jgi:hypothetical protein
MEDRVTKTVRDVTSELESVFWTFVDIGTRIRDIDRPGLCCPPLRWMCA